MMELTKVAETRKRLLISKAILTPDKRGITKPFSSVFSSVTNPRVSGVMAMGLGVGGGALSSSTMEESCTCKALRKWKGDILSSFVPIF